MTDEFNYLSLNHDNDQKEPLISENQIKFSDSSNLVENIKTLSHCETMKLYEEEPNNNDNNDNNNDNNNNDNNNNKNILNLKFQQYFV